MGLKHFLQEQGFIANDDSASAPAGNAKSSDKGDSNAVANTPPAPMAPVIFPMRGVTGSTAASQPSFVQDLPDQQSAGEAIDPAFIKFYEDEMARVNLPGPDYFEFRQQMMTMNQKMAGKGIAPELILQTVVASFEAQNIPASKLAEAARFYKGALSDKKDGFLKGAAAEQDNQLQKRTATLQQHQTNIDGMARKIQDLQQQIQQLNDALAKERTQMDIDKTMGKEGIEKIERASRQIGLAFTYMTNAIDRDISLLQSS